MQKTKLDFLCSIAASHEATTFYARPEINGLTEEKKRDASGAKDRINRATHTATGFQSL